uniref:RNase H type-1 domain-containing protein n=1 Tax=Quercus lobata TaxID=97700 RepID=A0A7N2LZ31_QUELO
MIESLADAKLDVLIDASAKQWNHHLIDGIFVPKEAELIKNIPLSRMEGADAAAKERLEEFVSVQPTPWIHPPRTRDRWRPPPSDLVKINFDGVFAKEHKFGIGVVVREDQGSV